MSNAILPGTSANTEPHCLAYSESVRVLVYSLTLNTYESPPKGRIFIDLIKGYQALRN